MRVVFFKGKGDWGDTLIRWWTWSPYSHCELEFANGDRFSAHPSLGTGFRPALTPEEFDVWAAVPVVLPAGGEEAVRSFCVMQAGSRYDWPGILLSQVLPLNKHASSRWFCSELCVSALKVGGFAPLYGQLPNEFSPARLYDFLTTYQRGLHASVAPSVPAVDPAAPGMRTHSRRTIVPAAAPRA